MGEQDVSDETTIAQCVEAALGERPLGFERQALTQSGNTVYRACMPGGRSLAVRLSAQAQTFSHTRANLAVLRDLGLPVQTVLAEGALPAGGAFVVLDWLPGRDLYYAFDTLDAARAERIAATVTGFQRRAAEKLLAAAHGGFGWAAIGARAPYARWTQLFGEPAPAAMHTAMLARAQAAPLDRFRARLGLVRASLEDYFDALHPVCFLDDLTIKNVLVEEGELSGVIDFDTVCYGDPLMVLGVTLAHLEADVGERGRPYGDALLRCWAPKGMRLRATGFYASLWATGFLSIALDAGDQRRALALARVVDSLLHAAERA